VLEQAQDERRWLKRFGRCDAGDIRLLCFHYAGGNASMFRDLPRLLPRGIEPVAVQLPGRADRLREPPYDSMVPLVDRLVDVVRPLLDRPFACYGVSMGARVALALTHALRDRGMPMPRKLYVASSGAPCLDLMVREWDASDDGLVDYMRDLGGTPPEILGDTDLLMRLLPTLRADLTLLHTHPYRPVAPVDVAIQAFAGTDDVEASPERMGMWRLETSARFDIDVLAGGHFLTPDGERHIIEVIGSDLS
jgi:surfactin synthase thioesterase subunit